MKLLSSNALRKIADEPHGMFVDDFWYESTDLRPPLKSASEIWFWYVDLSEAELPFITSISDAHLS